MNLSLGGQSLCTYISCVVSSIKLGHCLRRHRATLASHSVKCRIATYPLFIWLVLAVKMENWLYCMLLKITNSVKWNRISSWFYLKYILTVFTEKSSLLVSDRRFWQAVTQRKPFVGGFLYFLYSLSCTNWRFKTLNSLLHRVCMFWDHS